MHAVELAGCRQPAVETLADLGHHPVDEIAPVRDQLVVDPPNDIRVRDLGVVLFGQHRRQRVTQRVRLEPIEVLADPAPDPGGLRRLRATERHVLVCRDVGRQVQPTVADQHRGPDHRVERNVVLADEVVTDRVRILPPVAPGLRVARPGRPLPARRQIADDRLEPDIDALARTELVGGQRHTPVKIPGDRPVVQTVLDELQRPVHDMPAPALARFQPRQQVIGKGRQPQEEVRGGPLLRKRTSDLAARIQQDVGVKRTAAVLALVTTSLAVGAERAAADHVPIRQEPASLRIEELDGLPRRDVAGLAEPGEHLLDNLTMVVGHRRGEQVEADPEIIPDTQELRMVTIDDLDRRHAVSIGTDSDRRTVGVAPGHHEDPVSRHPVIARENVSRQIGTGDVPQMGHAVGIWPRHRDQDRSALPRGGDQAAGLGRHAPTVASRTKEPDPAPVRARRHP